MHKLLHQNYYQSIYNLFILNQTILISDIIYLILNLFFSAKSEPILIGLAIEQTVKFNCTDHDTQYILNKVYEIYPNIRTIIKILNNDEFINYIRTSKLLAIHSSNKWMPFWCLIPGQLWDNNQGDNLIHYGYHDIDNEIKYINEINGFSESKDLDSIKVTRTKIVNGKPVLNNNGLSFDDFIQWVSASLTDEQFLSMQNK